MKKIVDRIINFIKSDKVRNAVKKVVGFVNGHKVRVALSLVLIAIIFVVPQLTQAQYKWKLNGYTIVAAKELYFDGNYMHDSTKNITYRTTGWNGNITIMKPIEIRNFENALLANNKDEDIEYVLKWKVDTFVCDENGTITVGDYKYREAYDNEKFGIAEVDRTAQDKDVEGSGDKVFNNTDYATGIMIGNGSPKKDVYKFELQQPVIYSSETPEVLPWNSFIRVTLTAENVAFNRDEHGNIILDDYKQASYRTSDSYSKKISCIFEYVLTSGEGYITRFDPEDDTYDKLKVWIGTGEIIDAEAQSQTITVWWDKTKLNIDPFNIVFQDMMQKQRDQGVQYYKETYGEGALANYSSLTITGLASYYTGYLDFFKVTGITLSYPEPEGGAPVNHPLTKMQPWFYTYTVGEDQFLTRSLLVEDNMKLEPGTEPPLGKILGYYAKEKDK